MCDQVSDKEKLRIQDTGRETEKKYKSKKDSNIGQIIP